MATETTQLAPLARIEPTPRTLGTQAQALLAATLLAEAFPQFAGAYLTFHPHFPNEVSVQAASLAEVETWREALGADPEAVRSQSIGRDVELFFEVPKFGALVRVYAIQQVAAQPEQVAA
ncbi:hypothetical protein [Streptomyces sp. NPDC051636]|uniref:hypothetical protein n=1 Tax=Streptomyces sp. NPDC051636 TaxID=3365663 RepID=UPI0037874A66